MVVFMHLTYSFALLAQTEKVAPTQNQILPADFPKYTDTGKPEQDNQKYNAAKQVWIAANPAVYEKIVAQQQATPKNKLEAEISPAPPATQITEMIPPYNPTSTANLSKQTPNYNKEQQLSTTAEPFADFPKYTDTGNPQQDNQKYTAAKQAWIAANPALHEKMNAQNESVPQNNITPTTQTQNHDKVDSARHYPIVPTTGNVAVDEKAHIEAKNNWIKTHPEEYRQAGGNPEELNNDKATNETTTPNKPVFVLPTFNAQKTYQLIKAEAVPVAGQKKTTAEIAEETEKLKEDFPENKTQLQIGANNQVRIYASGVIDVRATEKRNDNKVEWFFENKECATCSKILYLDIEQETDTLLTYVMQSEDENALYAYRLAFQLTPKP
jgi:hypothetical protein